jgi:hypothetical protein
MTEKHKPGYTVMWDADLPFHKLSDEALMDAVRDARQVMNEIRSEEFANPVDVYEQSATLRALVAEAEKRGLE